jgi:HlyD family secretion protein
MSSRTMKQLQAGLIGVLLVAAPGLAQAEDAAKPAPAAALQGPAVSVFTAARAEVSELVQITGTLIPREEVLVSPEVEGLGVSEVLVDIGDKVEKGQVLARLNKDTLDAQVAQYDAQLAQGDASKAQAEAQLAQAKANRLLAGRALDRTEALKAKGFATTATLDQGQASAAVNDALVDAAKKSIDVTVASRKATQAQKDQVLWRIGRAEVRSPSDGVVSQRNVRLGQIGSSAGNAMFRIIENGDVELEAELPDVSLPRVAKGMPVVVLPAGLTEPLTGTVRLIAPEIDKATRLGKIRVALKQDERLRIGGSASGTIEIGRKTAVTLPIAAVSYDKDGAYVQLVKDNRIKTMRVTVGLRGAQLVEVATGLEVGDQVVARAGTFVRDGDKVRPVPAATN